ncbi:MAG: 5,6-dimethylbenzimidazole synthase [Verrucomicrobiae bacterium]|nr:5,6-dimethylbenzimidazole synthase [Verrucomicrobiae bacterium]
MNDAFTAEEREIFYRVIRTRRDVRRFVPGEIPAQTLWRILEAAHAAPSVGFSQPWRFILVRSMETRRKVRALFEDVNAGQSAQIAEEPRRNLYDSLKLEGILESSLNIAVVCRDPGEFVLGAGPMPQTIRDSVCLAIGNLWLAARAEGVGVGWVSILRRKEVETLLGLPERTELVAWLCVGIAEQFEERPMLETAGWKGRDALGDCVFEERWPGLDPVQRAAQEQFDRQSSRYGKGHILENVEDVAQALKTIPFRPGATALDVATGGGHTGLLLAACGYRVTLADLAPGMLARAAALAAERGLTVETRQHAAESLPYADGGFDLVTCRVAAHHFSSPEEFVRETCRVLRPGGHFLLIDGSVPDDEPETEEWLHQVEKWRDPSHHRFLTPRRWAEICGAAGLKVLLSELHPFRQPDLQWYFETAATPDGNREEVLRLVREASPRVREIMRLGEEDGKTVWSWSRLTLVALKGAG